LHASALFIGCSLIAMVSLEVAILSEEGDNLECDEKNGIEAR
jgi:hypothetical protein